VNSLKRFVPYYGLLAPYKVAFIAAILCGLLYAVASGLGFPYVVKENIPIIFGNDREVTIEQSEWVLLQTLLLLPLTIFVRALAGFLNIYLTAYCGVKVLEKVRSQVFSKLQDLHVSYFQDQNKGDLISRLMVDCNAVKQCIVEVSNSLIKEPLTFLAALSYLVWLSIKNQQNLFLLFCLAAVPVCILPIRYIGKKLTRRARQLQAQSGTVTEVASENLGAIREIRAFSLEDSERQKFGHAVSKFLRFQLGVIKYDKSLSPLIELITGLAITGAIFVAARSQLNLQVDEVISLFLALHMCYQPIKKMGAINNHLKRGIASLDRIEEVLHAPILVEEKPDAVPLTEKIKGQLRFENVSFQYDTANDHPVLKGIDETLEPGKTYALVGHSGAGKSTFINLVLRFYDPTVGRILLDGHDLRDLRLKNLRHQIALVPQDPVLFNDTIMENIRLSRPEATPEEILRAAEKANALGFIEDEPDGFDTLVGDRGTRLSGGQKQRIAIARAFLRDSPILILDEASSALDSESESRVQAELQTLMQGKTVLMIAHRFATLKLADEILVFDEGLITARGDHAKLMATSPVYQNLYEKQEL
jgi:subfamily B ATP-binding cassette protein MsbA